MTFETKPNVKSIFSAKEEEILCNVNNVTDSLIKLAIDLEIDGAQDIGADFDAHGCENGSDEEGTNFYGQIVDLFDLSGYGIDETTNGIEVYHPNDVIETPQLVVGA